MAKFMRFLIKLALVALVTLGFYVLYLDGVVTQRFAEARYQAPALLYSRPLTLDPVTPVSRDTVLNELAALNYRTTTYARQPGEYREQGQQLLVYRRAFEFPERVVPAERILVTFDARGLLKSVVSWPEQHGLPGIQLEPQLIGRFAAGESREDRLLVGLEQVPPLLTETLLLIEDQNYYHHYGVEPSAIVRAAWVNLQARRTVQGGSTITQQLVKNMFLTQARTFRRKLNEGLMALILDFRFSKDDILEAYFNEVYFGQDRGRAIHGVELASQFYFGKSTADLQPADIALLVAMIQGPSWFDPRRHPERARQRRDLVLRRMLTADLISQPQYLAAVKADFGLRAQGQLVATDRPHYVDQVQQELSDLLTDQSWSRTGLRVFTYFDPQAQEAARRAVTQSTVLQESPELELAMVVAHPGTGAITAMLGGRQPIAGGFNRAINARRQIGSLMKSLVYTEALREPDRFTLATVLADEPLALADEAGAEWVPRNFGRDFAGPVSLYQAWLDSRNIPAVRVGQEVGPRQLQQRLRELGLPAPHAYPSLALGTVEMSPLEVTQLYQVLAGQGQQHSLTSIRAVTTHRGELIYERPKPAEAHFYTPETAFLSRYALTGVVSDGTARHSGLNSQQAAVAGKTGSTNDFRDSWFVSFDERQLVTVWVGRDDYQSTGHTGSSGALPLATIFWQDYGVQPLDLSLPAGVVADGAGCSLGLPGMAGYPATNCQLPPLEDAEPAAEAPEEETSWWRRLFGGP